MRLGVCVIEQLNNRHSYCGITSGRTIQVCRTVSGMTRGDSNIVRLSKNTVFNI